MEQLALVGAAHPAARNHHVRMCNKHMLNTCASGQAKYMVGLRTRLKETGALDGHPVWLGGKGLSPLLFAPVPHPPTPLYIPLVRHPI